ncbi:MAG TPA: hypothetical protein VGC05_23920, partial [Mycobacterium sp.]
MPRRGSHPYIGRQWKPCAFCTSEVPEEPSLIPKPSGPACPPDEGGKQAVAQSTATTERLLLLFRN